MTNASGTSRPRPAGAGAARPIAIAIAITIALVVAFSNTQAQRPPNIVVIVADDMGYADIGVHGARDIPTPNIDALARGGIRFTDAYVTGPYCSPTRAGLLTGRYPQRFGHEFNLGLNPGLGLPLDEKTLADRLKAAGYRTALFGKWHLGADSAFHPMSRGFDEFFGFLGGAHSYLDVMAETQPILDGRKPAQSIGYLTDTLSSRAVDFIQRQRSQPFFLYLAFNAVHTPMHATDKYLARFVNIGDDRRRTYAAMLSAMDDGIGRTMAALREQNLEENTLIFFFSDNGGPTMPGTTINGSSNAPLRGSKRQTWEGGIRVPFIIRWKGRLAEGKIDSRPIIQLDVLPTALTAAGVPVTPEWKLDGVDLLPFLTTQTAGQPHDVLFWRLGSSMAIRKGDWKLVRTQDGALRADYEELRDLSSGQLYNLKADIAEKDDLSARYPDKKKELADAWQRWNQDLAPPRWRPGRGAGAGGARHPD
jgi:arylsulfatase A-like enzyme